MRKKVGFFPGKFHPLHIGHVQTILRLLPDYKKIIVGITEDKPKDAIIDRESIKRSFNLFLRHFKTIEIRMIKGVLIERNDLSGLPEFDVLLSGNPIVLAWARKHGVQAKYVRRSEGVFRSGTEIRSAVNSKENNEDK